MIWYVINEDNGRFVPYNVFWNRCFKEAVECDIFNIPELTRDEVSELLQRFAQWQFWSRCEYEIVLYSWPTGKDEKGHKIDVFDQLKANWERFVDYVYQCYCFRTEEEENV